MIKKRQWTWLAIVGTVGLVAWFLGARRGVAPPPSVPAAGRSLVAAAIIPRLQFGGEFYAVVDTRTEVEAAGQTYVKAMTALAQTAGSGLAPDADFHREWQRLGLWCVAGAGASSWRAPGSALYHNRAFFYLPEGRQGLLKISGGLPGPFVAPTLAPPDADAIAESTVNLPALADVVFDFVRDFGGADKLAQAVAYLHRPVAPGLAVTWQDLLEHFDTRVFLIARAAPTDSLPAATPPVDFLLGLDGAADLLPKFDALLKTISEPGQKNGFTTYALKLPLPGLSPAYHLELLADPQTQRLYLASRPEFADATVFAQGGHLGDTQDYLAATANLPSEGNLLVYVSPNGGAAAARFYRDYLNRKSTATAFPFPGFDDSIWAQLPHGVAAVQTNLPDGVFAQSNWPDSNKSILALPTLELAAIAGLWAEPVLQSAHQF
jgi:hypothetical protein